MLIAMMKFWIKIYKKSRDRNFWKKYFKVDVREDVGLGVNRLNLATVLKWEFIVREFLTEEAHDSGC